MLRNESLAGNLLNKSCRISQANQSK